MAVVALLLLLFTWQGLQPHHQPDSARFCFGEWCLAPLGARASGDSTVVLVRVSSDARVVSQRPDHPQAWLRRADGREAGGPQPPLSGRIGPGASYVATLTFGVRPDGRCMTLTATEGGWPPFLGLGYATSPFTERVDWQLCP
jgi:hypothetical protein